MRFSAQVVFVTRSLSPLTNHRLPSSKPASLVAHGDTFRQIRAVKERSRSLRPETASAPHPRERSSDGSSSRSRRAPRLDPARVAARSGSRRSGPAHRPRDVFKMTSGRAFIDSEDALRFASTLRGMIELEGARELEVPGERRRRGLRAARLRPDAEGGRPRVVRRAPHAFRSTAAS